MTIFDVEIALHKVSFKLADLMLIYELHKRGPNSIYEEKFKVELNEASERMKDYLLKAFQVELDKTVFKNLVLANYEKNLRDMYLNMN